MSYIGKEDIETIYKKYILQCKTNSYLRKSQNIPLYFLNNYEGVEFPRVFQLSEFKTLIENHNISSQDVLNFNGPDPELKYLNHENVDYLNYNPLTGENDMHNFTSNKLYDFIIFMETLEHLSNPYHALKNIYNITKQGGFVFTSVPTVNLLHDYPYNFITGFTPMGLGAIFKISGFEILHIGQWGNRKYIELTFNWKWPDWRDMRNKQFFFRTRIKSFKEAPRHYFQDGFINEFDFPVKTWILARKTSDID